MFLVFYIPINRNERKFKLKNGKLRVIIEGLHHVPERKQW